MTCVFSSTPQEHDQNLLKLMKNRKCNGHVFNIAFYIAAFTKHGMNPNPVKVQALQDLPSPDSQKSFLGLINYLQPFIPDLYDKTAFLKAQLLIGTSIHLTDAAFWQLRAWIFSWLLNTNLAYYIQGEAVIIQTNASKYGLGNTLVTGWLPHSLCQQDLNRYWDQILQYRKGMSIHMFLPWEVPYLHLWKTRHCVNWQQAPKRIQHKPIHAASPHL